MTEPSQAARRRLLLGRRRDRNPQGELTLAGHLREFRNRLGISLLALIVGVVVGYFLWTPILDFLRRPLCELPANKTHGCNLYIFHPLDGFVIRLRVSLLAGVLFSAPIWLYQLGAFITPGLHKKERRWAGGFLVVSLLLFGTGVFFAYFTVSRGLSFLLGVAGNGITPVLDVSGYLSFVTLMLLAFGVSFEFPVVIMFLNVVGVLSTDRMRRWRRGMIFGIFVFAAVITPSQDPFTFLAMAVPLCVMYEGCILLGRWRDRARRQQAIAAGYEDIPDDEPSPLDVPYDST